MKLKLVIALISTYSIVGCGKSEKAKQNEESNKVFVADMHATGGEGISQGMLSSLVVYGKYSNCQGKTENETWQISKNVSTSTLIVKKGDTHCKIYVTGFTMFQSSTMQQYNVIGGNGLLVTSDFSATASELTSGSGAINKKLFTYVKITPADFSEKPTLAIHITNIKNEDPNPPTIIKDVYVVDQNNMSFNMHKAPNFKLDHSNLKVYLDKHDDTLSLQGDVKFDNQDNDPIGNLHYAIVPSSVATGTFEEISNAFTGNSVFISSSSFSIPGTTLHEKANFPANWNVNDNIKAKVILRATNTIDNKSFYSFQIFDITLTK